MLAWGGWWGRREQKNKINSDGTQNRTSSRSHRLMWRLLQWRPPKVLKQGSLIVLDKTWASSRAALSSTVCILFVWPNTRHFSATGRLISAITTSPVWPLLAAILVSLAPQIELASGENLRRYLPLASSKNRPDVCGRHRPLDKISLFEPLKYCDSSL